MVTAKSTRRQPGGNPPVVARNLYGTEITIDVISHAGLISVHSSDGRDLIMTPAAAAELVMQILHELGGRLLPPAGPLTGVM